MKKRKRKILPRFSHRVRLKLELSSDSGLGEGVGGFLFYMNHYKFLKIHQLKITVLSQCFGSIERDFLFIYCRLARDVNP